MAFHIYNYPFLKDLSSPLSSASLYPPQRLPTRATPNHLLSSNNNNSKILGVNSGKRKCVSVRVQTTERRAMPEDKMSIIAKEITLLEFELNTGAKIPSVGLGTWQSESGIVGQAVEKAIKVGYRHIDCARSYGNEKEIGSVLKKLFDDEVVKRDDLFITSKLWCTDHAPEDVPVALDKTLEDLQLDYLDLYLIHWPARLRKGAVGMNPEDFVPVDIPTTWKAMEALYDSGKARAIGICNVSTKKLDDLLDLSRIPPAVVQVECHPVWQQTKLQEFCKSKGVHLTGYSPLGSPGTAMYKSAVLKHPVVITTAEKLGKTPAQVALRWGLQMGHSVLPKSTNESRIKENFDVFDWSIPDELFAKFSEIDQERQVTGDFFVHVKFGSYRTVEDIWDGEL